MAATRRFNDIFSALPTTVFEEMSLLAARHGSTNLGQGFPDNVSRCMLTWPALLELWGF